MNGHFVSICLVAAVVPWASMGAQLVTGRPVVKQPAAPPSLALLPDLASLILSATAVRLPAGLPGDPALPSGVQGGREAEGTVTLRTNATGSGAVIALSSGNIALLRVPVTVTVPAGTSSAKFRYELLPVTEPTTATVLATYNSQTKTDAVLILPPSLEALTLDSLQIQGGKAMSGRVNLDGAGPSDKDIMVALSSNHPAVEVPAFVSLRGVRQKVFSFTARGVGQPVVAVVSASFADRKREAAFTVVPASLRPFGDDVDCNPQGTSGDESDILTITASLTGPAPSDGGATIQMTSSSPNLFPVPATLSIPPDAILVRRRVECRAPTEETVVSIAGTYRGVTQAWRVKVKLMALPDLTVSAVMYNATGDVITQPTDSQPFKLCALVAQSISSGPVTQTKVLHAYQHSRGFSKQVELEVDMTRENPQACEMIEGLQTGEYVDVTLTVDPSNTIPESYEGNNVRRLRATR